jgi:hypothetical protein
MSVNQPADVWAPGPEDLAAFVDGELDPRRRRQVEAWLALHPDSASELQAHQRLGEFWKATAPVQPGVSQWTRVLARIEKAAWPGRWSPPIWRRPMFPFALAVIGTAAALFVGFTLIRWQKTPDAYPSDDSRFRLAAPERGEMVQAQPMEHFSLVREEQRGQDTLKVSGRSLRAAHSDWPKPLPPTPGKNP